MFQAELTDTNLLKNSLQSISNVITEGVFQFTEDGVKLVAADPAMVAMVDFEMDKDAFDSYECDAEEKLGLNIEDFYSIIRRANSDDRISLSMDEDESKLQVTMQNHSTRTFSLALLNLDENDVPSTSDLQYSTTADLQTSVLASAVGDAAVAGDSVTVSVENDALVISSSGNNSNAEFRIQQGSDGLMDLTHDGEARSMFSLDYLNKMTKAGKLSDTVRMQLGQDFPMRLEFQIPDKLRLAYILAPRIEED